MVNEITKFLFLLHEIIPTEKERHNITYNMSIGVLELSVFAKGGWYVFEVVDEDLLDYDFIVNEIKMWIYDD